MSDKSLNSSGASHASSLVASGKISDDKSWSAPSAAASDAYIAKHSMGEYGKWFMGVDAEMDKDTKGHYAYPFSNGFEKVSLRGLRAIISRAGQSGAKAIEEKAKSLYDEAKKKLGKDKERSDAGLAGICVRKSTDRMLRNEVFVTATSAAGYTASDLFKWLEEELCDVIFPGQTEPSPFCVWPCNFVMPEHEKGETWQVITQGPKGCMYAIDFTLGDAGVTITGIPKEVISKDQYVILDQIVEEASDEMAGRTEKTKSERKLEPGRMYRIFEITAEQADEKTFKIPVSYASELPGMQRCGGYDGREAPTDCERAAGLTSGQVYWEILDHGPDSVDHSIINNSGAVLDEHDNKDHIGVVDKGSSHTEKSTRVARADLILDNHGKGAVRFRQMKSGSRPHLSAGYKHTKYLGSETLPNGEPAHRFAWRALEISSVAVPLDGSIGVGRSYKELPTVDSTYNDKSLKKSPEPKEKSMTDDEKKEMEAKAEKEKAAAVEKAKKDAEVAASTETVAKVKAAEVEALRSGAEKGANTERERVKEIGKIRAELIKARADQAKAIDDLTEKAIGEGITANDFKFKAMTDILSAKPAPTHTMKDLGYNEKERQEFSLLRAIQNIVTQADKGVRNAKEPDPDTFEGEVCRKMRKAYESSGTPIVGGGATRGSGFLVPSDGYFSERALTRRQRQQMQRDATMQATIFGQGGAAVATELLLPIVEILRNEMVTDKLGVTSMAGLEGNIIIPRQAAAATAYAVAETAALTLSGQVLDQIPLAPKRVGAWAQYSKQFLLQASIDVENFIRTDLFAVIALIWDEYIIAGQGGQGQPTGILYQNGVGLVNGTGAFTGYSGDAAAVSWADIVNFDTQINKVNARRQGRGWCTTSNARGRLETLAKLLVGATTVASIPLWESDVEPMGRMKGYPAVDSQQVPSDLLIFGVWANNVIHALWGGLDIVVDPYSLSQNSEVKIVMNTWGDVALRHPQEFCISLNSAAL
jgi:HK97 family phage major capsid protein